MRLWSFGLKISQVLSIYKYIDYLFMLCKASPYIRVFDPKSSNWPWPPTLPQHSFYINIGCVFSPLSKNPMRVWSHMSEKFPWYLHDNKSPISRDGKNKSPSGSSCDIPNPTRFFWTKIVRAKANQINVHFLDPSLQRGLLYVMSSSGHIEQCRIIRIKWANMPGQIESIDYPRYSSFGLFLQGAHCVIRASWAYGSPKVGGSAAFY